MKSATCSFLAVLLFAAAAVAAEVPWNVESYNPQPLDDDLNLPMPCGGAMTFRRVNVPSAGILGDEPVHLGSHQTEYGYVEYHRKAWLAGAFDDDDVDRSGRRHYLIGKYEVTAMQFAVFDEQCLDPHDPDLELPATELSWAEAMLFAERYSEWLVNNARDRLPDREGAVGFIRLPDREGAVGFMRLPTEAEWEFAARGGTKVSESERAAITFVPSGKLDEYVLHDGNSYRELGLIGTLKPNPLGIHDILGNAAEMVLDPFRLDAVGRLHGQAGGFVVRGGSFRTRPSEIRTSHRIENPPVDSHGIRRQKTTGFRLVLVAPSLPDRESVQRVREAWEARQQQPALPGDDSGSRLAEEQKDPVKEARALAKAAGPEMKSRLENLAAVIAENVRARKEERERAARESLDNAVFAAHRVIIDVGLLEKWCGLAKSIKDPSRSNRYRQRFAENHKNYEFNVRYYLDKLTKIDEDYGDVDLPSQATVLKPGYDDLGLTRLPPIADRVLAHVDRVRRSGTSAAPAIVSSLAEMASVEMIEIREGELKC